MENATGPIKYIHTYILDHHQQTCRYRHARLSVPFYNT